MTGRNKEPKESNTESTLLIAFGTGLLPFVAICANAYDGVVVGVVILLTLILSTGIFATVKNVFKKRAQLSAYIIITSGVVAVLGLLIQAFFKEAYDMMGIYLPIMAVSVSVIGIGGGSVSGDDFGNTLQNAAFEGAAGILVLFAVGSIREILGDGRWLLMPLPEIFPKFQIFKTPAGGFLVYGVTLAVLSISLNAFAQKQSLLNQLHEGPESVGEEDE